jgi:hypothetical protein
MDDRDDDTTTRAEPLDARPASRIRRRRAGVLLAALLPLALLATACGGGSDGPSVANVGSNPQHADQSSASNGSKKSDPLKYSRCMRKNGIADFPDPNGNGEIMLRITGGPGSSDLEPNNPKFKAAQEACKALAPTMGTPEEQADRRAATLKYAKCMRAHGITEFPDPNSSGGLEIKGTPGGNLDPGSPQFQTAEKACKKLLPGGPKGGGPGGGTFQKHLDGAP